MTTSRTGHVRIVRLLPTSEKVGKVGSPTPDDNESSDPTEEVPACPTEFDPTE